MLKGTQITAAASQRNNYWLLLVIYRDHKITGQLKYAYSDLCAPVPSISPLYCSPFTQYGTGMYAGQAASNWNAVNTAINSACPAQQDIKGDYANSLPFILNTNTYESKNYSYRRKCSIN